MSHQLLCIDMPFRPETRSSVRALLRHETDCGMLQHDPEERMFEACCGMSQRQSKDSRVPDPSDLEKQDILDTVAWNGLPGGITINVSVQSHACSFTSSSSMRVPTWCDAPRVKTELGKSGPRGAG